MLQSNLGTPFGTSTLSRSMLSDSEIGSTNARSSHPVDPIGMANDDSNADSRDLEEDKMQETSNSWEWEEKFVQLCDKIYPAVTGVVLVFAYGHGIIFIVIAIATAIRMVAIEIIVDAFRIHTREHIMSPFVPVWYDISSFPFDTLLMYINAYSFLCAIIFFLIAFLSIIVNCRTLEEGKDERALLIFTSLMMCQLKVFTLGYPDFYNQMLFDSISIVSKERLCSEYHVLGTGSFTSFFNMVMLMVFKWNETPLRSMLESHYRILSTNSITGVFNMAMLMGECCGVNGPHDFLDYWDGPRNITVTPEYNPHERYTFRYISKRPEWPDKKMNIFFEVPAACCPQPHVGDPVDVDFKNMRRCVGWHGGLQEFYTQGCRSVYEDSMRRYVMPVLAADDALNLFVFFAFSILNLIKMFWMPVPYSDGDDSEKGVRRYVRPSRRPSSASFFWGQPSVVI